MMKLAIIGFGEVGQIFARQFREHGVKDIAVYDILFRRSHQRAVEGGGSI